MSATYLAQEAQAIEDAKAAYLEALRELQANCDHETVLKYTNSEYRTTRICEDCGYFETAQWDSPLRYKDQNLVKRAYDVSWDELHDAFPKVRAS